MTTTHRKTELLKCGLDQVRVLLQDVLQISAPVLVGVDEELHVEEVPHLFVVEDQDALEQDHVRRENLGELSRPGSNK